MQAASSLATTTVPAFDAALAVAHPGPGALATLAQGGLLTRCFSCVEVCALGNTLLFGFAALSVLCTMRFLLSFNPQLETAAVQQRALPWSMLTLLDPVLQPVRRHAFGLAPSDPDYASVALLAVLASVLEALVGDTGLLAGRIPDPELLAALRSLVLAQHCFLLVSRWVRLAVQRR